MFFRSPDFSFGRVIDKSLVPGQAGSGRKRKNANKDAEDRLEQDLYKYTNAVKSKKTEAANEDNQQIIANLKKAATFSKGKVVNQYRDGHDRNTYGPALTYDPNNTFMPDDSIFDVTTNLFEDHLLNSGSITDQFNARQAAAVAPINWTQHDEQLSHFSHGDVGGLGIQSNLARRLGVDIVQQNSRRPETFAHAMQATEDLLNANPHARAFSDLNVPCQDWERNWNVMPATTGPTAGVGVNLAEAPILQELMEWPDYFDFEAGKAFEGRKVYDSDEQ